MTIARHLIGVVTHQATKTALAKIDLDQLGI